MLGVIVSQIKTNTCVNEREASGTGKLQEGEVIKVHKFKYLGSTVQSSRECGNEGKKQVQAQWSGWKKKYQQ